MNEILKRYPENLLHPVTCDFQDGDLKNKFDRQQQQKVLQLVVK